MQPADRDRGRRGRPAQGRTSSAVSERYAARQPPSDRARQAGAAGRAFCGQHRTSRRFVSHIGMLRVRVTAGLLVRVWLVLLGSTAVASANDLRLLEAVRNQDREAVRALLEQHVDVNTPQGDGATALHWAAHRDDAETADLLIRAGANVNAANDLGVTPIAL